MQPWWLQINNINFKSKNKYLCGFQSCVIIIYRSNYLRLIVTYSIMIIYINPECSVCTYDSESNISVYFTFFTPAWMPISDKLMLVITIGRANFLNRTTGNFLDHNISNLIWGLKEETKLYQKIFIDGHYWNSLLLKKGYSSVLKLIG